MVKLLGSGVAVTAMAMLATTSFNVAKAEELCSIPPITYEPAKTEYPDLAFAIKAIEEYSIAAWYTDRLTTAERTKMLKDITTKCSEDTRMTIVVYGIPDKDCNAGLSTDGSVKSTADYKSFLKELTDAVGDRKVLYVVEPDAVGLLAEDGGCGQTAGYLDNLKVAVEALSANANAELYVDVGYWTLEYEGQRTKVVSAMTELSSAGQLKGITINTSNYRTTKQVAELCTNFQTAMGKKGMNCIVDTSRNYNEPKTTDWCNVLEAGIGHPPTSETNITNLDYFMWVKPPGESDGTCTVGSVTGTTAGTFFEVGFQHLWNQGYFVKSLGMKTVGGGGSTSSQTTDTSSSSQTSSSQTTESSASQANTESGASQSSEESSASQSTEESSASQSTEEGSASETTDASSSQSATTPASTPATPTATTIAPTTPTATEAPTVTTTTEAPTATTDAPTQNASNCKVRRRLRKF
ncbi:hypothetical protein PHYBOEH_009357 [Phytophthora boehmeriae]|uniref:Glycoside hydrolase n=1 Tax=Phytophthora boehmeriae TaxID=109152 RepID=A0A8T1VTW4_9STRA|nr:hypothetical protein PHYBOEH_009357 [Phytophthora boehmeriae]